MPQKIFVSENLKLLLKKFLITLKIGGGCHTLSAMLLYR